VTQSRSIAGIFTPRPYGRRGMLRRVGATLGVLALLLQCLVVAVHQPVQAAVLSPFDDPHALCIASGGDSGPAVPDQGAPHMPAHAGVLCPICVSLQAAGPGLLPVLVALVLPMSAASTALLSVADTAAPEPFGQSAANPRAPPVPSESA
jgi:hypothetical protein